MVSRQLLTIYAIGTFLILAGIGLFAGSRVVKMKYYFDDDDDYEYNFHDVTIKYHALTWSGILAFVVGCGMLGWAVVRQRRNRTQMFYAKNDYNMQPQAPPAYQPSYNHAGAPPPAPAGYQADPNPYPPPPAANLNNNPWSAPAHGKS
ncbi:hypothetical protein IWQ62_005869 [Dispira parvispora]|uniref:Uncharacterized protein n=1 Tax=Dispira parvispora TaxID=1520584 RepID=A0A9W8E4U6_9FUNG|nr:hypothetical protein IWQ62_005869 [Dispira parvispora]